MINWTRVHADRERQGAGLRSCRPCGGGDVRLEGQQQEVEQEGGEFRARWTAGTRRVKSLDAPSTLPARTFTPARSALERRSSREQNVLLSPFSQLSGHTSRSTPPIRSLRLLILLHFFFRVIIIICLLFAAQQHARGRDLGV